VVAAVISAPALSDLERRYLSEGRRRSVNIPMLDL
jgi:hypothetical protein